MQAEFCVPPKIQPNAIIPDIFHNTTEDLSSWLNFVSAAGAVLSQETQ